MILCVKIYVGRVGVGVQQIENVARNVLGLNFFSSKDLIIIWLKFV